MNIIFLYFILKKDSRFAFRQKNLYVFNITKKLNFMVKKKEPLNIGFEQLFFIKKLTLIGLGFKYFIYKKYLFFLFGLSHYLLFKIPSNILLFCRKKKIFFLSNSNVNLGLFINLLRISKPPSVYKGKGLIDFTVFKNNIRLKKGKR